MPHHQLPSKIVAGDVFGYVFPTCSAKYPHPGMVLQTFEDPKEISVLKQKHQLSDKDVETNFFCLIVMLSHSQPAQGEYAELMQSIHKTNTLIDPRRDVFVCYQHYDVILMPIKSVRIGSVNGPYLGRMIPKFAVHYRRQLKAVQAYLGGKSALLPSGMYGT